MTVITFTNGLFYNVLVISYGSDKEIVDYFLVELMHINILLHVLYNTSFIYNSYCP